MLERSLKDHSQRKEDLGNTEQFTRSISEALSCLEADEQLRWQAGRGNLFDSEASRKRNAAKDGTGEEEKLAHREILMLLVLCMGARPQIWGFARPFSQL